MKPTITYDDFAKLDLRIGTVTQCEKKEGSDKLLRLTVGFGEEGTRNILSGISQWYKPEELKGKQFVFIVNLAPRKLMGEESEGMILAADIILVDDLTNKPVLLTPQSKTPDGSTIK